MYDHDTHEDIKTYMERIDTHKETMAYYILVQVARALAAIHEKGICHRDLRGETIKVEK